MNLVAGSDLFMRVQIYVGVFEAVGMQLRTLRNLCIFKQEGNYQNALDTKALDIAGPFWSFIDYPSSFRPQLFESSGQSFIGF